VKASLTVPITQAKQLWGYLIVHQCSAPRQWQTTEIELLQQLGIQVSIAIQQSELYEKTKQELLERQKAERKIAEQAVLIDIATDAIFVQDLSDQILFWNQGAERLYGWTTAEATGEKTKSLFNPDNELNEALQITIEQGSWQGEITQITKSGKKIIVASRWTLVKNESAQPKSILIVNSDITDKKQLEKQFYHIQRLESIGTLASGIAHDFNNILTPILGISQLLPLRLTNVDDQTKELLSTLTKSARRAVNLVKQILLFSRTSDGKFVTLQLSYLFGELIGIGKQTFPKSIEISDQSPSRELWTISADRTQMDQVFMNLMINARDAMPEGGTLTIRAENRYLDEHYALLNLEAKPGPYLVVTVSDTGSGIPPELVERIFDPFFTTKEVGKGTGLGLSTVMGIVKNHGGFVRVTSQLGKGTQFEVFLPAIQGEIITATLEEEMPNGNGELILIVEDESSIQEIMKTALEKYNYRTMLANDGIEAIALYAKNQPEISVVLMDMIMPNLDGVTTIRILKKMNPEVKIVAASGILDNKQLALQADAQTFLLKPYTISQLLKILNEVIVTS
jgi:PAS domain S-box-containing protein